jgi:CheY-like chemotaxis protein
VEVGQISPYKNPPTDLLIGKRVLLVDDNEINLRVAKGMLEGMGIEVVVAAHADEVKALLNARHDQPCFGFEGMIFDAMMPDMDGWRLAQWVRDLPGGKTIPLVMASSAIGRDTEHSKKSELFDVVLPKPLRRSTLARALATSLTDWQPAKPVQPASTVEPHRVLVVEDSIVNQKVAESFLARDGHQVTLAANGQDALDLLTDPNAFDLILMDVRMPVLDGLEATRRIREREAQNGWQRWPVMALTGNAMPEEKDECLAAGMDGCMTKPMRMSEINAIVAETPVRNHR